ncbi:hypothetical protein [Mycobacterium uberis]|uniref:hypothetical protein n=1 Tax=Mycobacterium uberis TaxID=2162698 RepID=UPI000E304AC5|nr:hypothetical protein [Mycobacterium uberis]
MLKNRAVYYLQHFNIHAHCLALHNSQEFNSPPVAAVIFDFVVAGHSSEALLPSVQNATPPKYAPILGNSELRQ